MWWRGNEVFHSRTTGSRSEGRQARIATPRRAPSQPRHQLGQALALTGAAAPPTMLLMRVGFSWLGYTLSGPGGIPRYFTELLSALRRRRPADHQVIYLQARQRPWLRQVVMNERTHLRMVPDREGSWLRWVQRDFPRHLAQDRIDVLHALSPIVPLQAPCPVVATIYDLIPLRMPASTLPPRERRAAAHWLNLSVRVANHLIVPSHHVKQALMAHYGLSTGRITVAPLGCAAVFYPEPKAASLVRRQWHLTDPYLLTVGTLVPRKGHDRLAEAMQLLRRLPGRYALVVVGKRWWAGRKALGWMTRDPQIRYLGVVSDHQLRHLYAAAAAVVLPSQYEGFGLPAVEAMACGAPVVAFRGSGLEEVVGKAGILVRPRSSQALARALQRLLTDPRLSEHLRRAGIRRATRFRWASTAQRHVAVYQRFLSC